MSKRRRHRRLFPRRDSASFISTPRIDHNKAAAYNAQRSPTTFGPRSDISHNTDSSFMHEVPETKGLSTYDPDMVDGKTGEPMGRRKKHQPRWPSERKSVIEAKHELLVIEHKEKNLISLYEVWQDQLRDQGVSQYHGINLDYHGITVTMFFHTNRFLFIWEYERIRYFSRTYYGREQAMAAKNNKEIAWIKQELIISRSE